MNWQKIFSQDKQHTPKEYFVYFEGWTVQYCGKKFAKVWHDNSESLPI